MSYIKVRYLLEPEELPHVKANMTVQEAMDLIGMTGYSRKAARNRLYRKGMNVQTKMKEVYKNDTFKRYLVAGRVSCYTRRSFVYEGILCGEWEKA